MSHIATFRTILALPSGMEVRQGGQMAAFNLCKLHFFAGLATGFDLGSASDAFFSAFG